MPTPKEVAYARQRYVAIRDALNKADSSARVSQIMSINNLDLKMIGRYSAGAGRKKLEELAASRKGELGDT